MGSKDRTHFVRPAEQVLLLAEPFPGPVSPLYDETLMTENLLVRYYVPRACILP